MTLVNYVDKRTYVADNFKEFHSTKRWSDDLSFASEEGKMIAVKMDNLADMRFEKYANEASNGRHKAIFKSADKARYQEIVARYGENGKMVGETAVVVSAASISYVGGLILGVGGKVCVGDLPVILASAALATKCASNDHPLLQMAQAGLAIINITSTPDELKAPLLAAQAVARAGLSCV